MIYKIEPMGKPRMTRSDKWRQRKCVMKYWEFKDQVRKLGIKIPDAGAHIIFTIAMPKSWTLSKRSLMNGRGHQTTPDADNLQKAILDAIFDRDEHIWDSRVTKLWGYESSIEIKNINS